jgi:hypothetical protein
MWLTPAGLHPAVLNGPGGWEGGVGPEGLSGPLVRSGYRVNPSFEQWINVLRRVKGVRGWCVRERRGRVEPREGFLGEDRMIEAERIWVPESRETRETVETGGEREEWS